MRFDELKVGDFFAMPEDYTTNGGSGRVPYIKVKDDCDNDDGVNAVTLLAWPKHTYASVETYSLHENAGVERISRLEAAAWLALGEEPPKGTGLAVMLPTPADLVRATELAAKNPQAAQKPAPVSGPTRCKTYRPPTATGGV